MRAAVSLAAIIALRAAGSAARSRRDASAAGESAEAQPGRWSNPLLLLSAMWGSRVVVIVFGYNPGGYAGRKLNA